MGELKQLPMTCSHCRGELQQVGRPRIKHYTTIRRLTEVELIDYICPNCGQQWVKYNYICYGFYYNSNGLIEKE